MSYEAECVQNGCEFMVRTEDEQEAIDAITHHTDRKHAGMNLFFEEEVRDVIINTS